jgi:hypothetical protein
MYKKEGFEEKGQPARDHAPEPVTSDYLHHQVYF